MGPFWRQLLALAPRALGHLPPFPLLLLTAVVAPSGKEKGHTREDGMMPQAAKTTSGPMPMASWHFHKARIFAPLKTPSLLHTLDGRTDSARASDDG